MAFPKRSIFLLVASVAIVQTAVAGDPELLFVAQGSLEVGFLDTTNKLFSQTLQQGDVFVFPEGLVHFQYNADGKNPAVAISAFGSANAGTVSLPNTLFNSTIDVSVLALSFKTDIPTIQKLKSGLRG